MEDIKKEDKYNRAKERVNDIKKFYTVLMGGIFTIILTAVINYVTNEWRYPWFLWVVLGISIKTIFRAMKLFGYDFFFGKNWEKRKIDELMKDDTKNNRWN